VTLPRGLKARAEREAARLRQEIGQRPAERVQVAELAAHLGVKVVSADRLVDRARLEEIERLQSFAFSAATFKVRGQRVIFHQPAADGGPAHQRRRSRTRPSALLRWDGRTSLPGWRR
jgi:hypothetical protein